MCPVKNSASLLHICMHNKNVVSFIHELQKDSGAARKIF
jgi:hypothetical protein